MYTNTLVQYIYKRNCCTYTNTRVPYKCRRKYHMQTNTRVPRTYERKCHMYTNTRVPYYIEGNIKCIQTHVYQYFHHACGKLQGGKEAQDAYSFPQKSPIIIGSFAERDMQVSASCISSQPCTVRCSELQRVAVMHIELQWFALSCSELRRVAVNYSALQWITARCNELHWFAVNYSAMQWVRARCKSYRALQWCTARFSDLQRVAVSYSALQWFKLSCSELQWVAAKCSRNALCCRVLQCNAPAFLSCTRGYFSSFPFGAASRDSASSGKKIKEIKSMPAFCFDKQTTRKNNSYFTPPKYERGGAYVESYVICEQKRVSVCVCACVCMCVCHLGLHALHLCTKFRILLVCRGRGGAEREREIASAWQCIAGVRVCANVAFCCSVLQCVAACCNMLNAPLISIYTYSHINAMSHAHTHRHRHRHWHRDTEIVCVCVSECVPICVRVRVLRYVLQRPLNIICLFCRILSFL